MCPFILYVSFHVSSMMSFFCLLKQRAHLAIKVCFYGNTPKARHMPSGTSCICNIDVLRLTA